MASAFFAGRSFHDLPDAPETDERPLESFEFRLLAPDGSELDSAHVEAAHQAVKSVLDTQLKTGGARELLLRELGPDAYERLIKDLAANTIQGLI